MSSSWRLDRWEKKLYQPKMNCCLSICDSYFRGPNAILSMYWCNSHGQLSIHDTDVSQLLLFPYSILFSLRSTSLLHALRQNHPLLPMHQTSSAYHPQPIHPQLRSQPKKIHQQSPSTRIDWAYTSSTIDTNCQPLKMPITNLSPARSQSSSQQTTS